MYCFLHLFYPVFKIYLVAVEISNTECMKQILWSHPIKKIQLPFLILCMVISIATNRIPVMEHKKFNLEQVVKD